MNIKLFRFFTSDQGTLGWLLAGWEIFATIELPWRNNAKNISCIPAGLYDLLHWQSARFGAIYMLDKVPDRSYILLHAGNVAGDTELGYLTHSSGCILLGIRFGTIYGQDAVMLSRIALNKFINTIKSNDINRLKIENNYMDQ